MSSHGDRLDKADDTMDRVTVRMDDWQIAAIDQLVENGAYANVSEFVRHAVDEQLEADHV
ncbi:ribbon-helix-helix domain-containing protein [Haloarcula argentinensis]|uniref:Ribbon-helix-helix protein, CopG family n=1 Tax=Haloarcula argentinensis TaxID=43776 RepID=A0A847UKD0_HALAR|nr:ribbon-helix-helix domain-containing protein [Haloarcula argentinensis]NLV14385.1 ribbon-helix-helix protein, CopG family [Haloarcula argentinensis]